MSATWANHALRGVPNFITYTQQGSDSQWQPGAWYPPPSKNIMYNTGYNVYSTLIRSYGSSIKRSVYPGMAFRSTMMLMSDVGAGVRAALSII